MRPPRACRLLPALLAVAASACGGREYGFEREATKPRRHVDANAAVGGHIEAMEAEFREAWARRDDPQALRAAIGSLRKLLDARGGEHYETLVLLSRAHYLLGELEEEKEARVQAYEEGMRFGDLALHTIPAFRAEFERTGTVEDAAQAVPASGIAAIYWDAVNQAKWANEQGKIKVIFVKDKVRKMIDRVLALDESWWYGAAHRYLGAYFAALPTIAGKDLAKSRRHFDRSLAIAPDFFSTHVLYADYLARNLNDRRAFREHLEYVLSRPADASPEVAPEQRIEQRKARRLLDQIDDLFDPEEPPDAAADAPDGEGAAEPAGGGS